jgi:hypothetical protein
MRARIVTSTYRYKRPPRKRKAVPLEGPAIVRRGAAKPETPPAPANDDRKPAIVTAKPKGRPKVWPRRWPGDPARNQSTDRADVWVGGRAAAHEATRTRRSYSGSRSEKHAAARGRLVPGVPWNAMVDRPFIAACCDAWSHHAVEVLAQRTIDLPQDLAVIWRRPDQLDRALDIRQGVRPSARRDKRSRRCRRHWPASPSRTSSPD